MKKKWYDYLWIWTIIYFALGFFNILFAWLGMIDFLVPLGFAIFGGNKYFCNSFCGRGQLLGKLGSKCSFKRPSPKWMSTKWFRYGFLAFFLGFYYIAKRIIIFFFVLSLKITLAFCKECS